MVAAMEMDWDRIEELRDERADLVAELDQATGEEAEKAEAALRDWDCSAEAEELAELTTAAGEYGSAEEAREAIEQDPLSVEVRSDWVEPGAEMTAAEFCILLCTGGPAVRIVGELDDHKQPDRAWVEYQDWFTPWREYHGEHAPSQGTLLAYCRCFYFGE
jgi:hypothetical protein